MSQNFELRFLRDEAKFVLRVVTEDGQRGGIPFQVAFFVDEQWQSFGTPEAVGQLLARTVEAALGSLLSVKGRSH